MESIRDELFNNHNEMEALFAASDSNLFSHGNGVCSVYRFGK